METKEKKAQTAFAAMIEGEFASRRKRLERAFSMMDPSERRYIENALISQSVNAAKLALFEEAVAMLVYIADELDRADTDEDCGIAANAIEPKLRALLAKIKP